MTPETGDYRRSDHYMRLITTQGLGASDWLDLGLRVVVQCPYWWRTEFFFIVSEGEKGRMLKNKCIGGWVSMCCENCGVCVSVFVCLCVDIYVCVCVHVCVCVVSCVTSDWISPSFWQHSLSMEGKDTKSYMSQYENRRHHRILPDHWLREWNLSFLLDFGPGEKLQPVF